jgi:hypothetical protein
MEPLGAGPEEAKGSDAFFSSSDWLETEDIEGNVFAVARD